MKNHQNGSVEIVFITWRSPLRLRQKQTRCSI